MLRWTGNLFSDAAGDLGSRIAGIAVLVGLFNVAAWTAAALLFRHETLLMGTAVLAFSLGLRHAVDADHIAAIDNVTRKLMQQGKRPVATGFFFSLGHSTIVVILSLLMAATAAGATGHFAFLADVGGTFGVAISSTFLFALAAVNLVVLVSLVRTFRRVRNGGRYSEEDVERILPHRGILARLFARLFHLVDRSWHMYPVGLLFGLGFDTATEVGLLGLSAAEGARGLSLWTIMVFPALFTAGMSLIDTADTVLMLGAYQWSFVKPLRKLYYNLTVTAVSVAVALLVGGLEVLGLLRNHWRLSGYFWNAVAAVDSNFGLLGYMIVGLFAASWIVSVLVYKLQRFDEV